ncbi:MAG: type I glutamate--ammonia ligase [Gammaproteobacteria bacterium]
MQLVDEQNIKFVDLQFTDYRGGGHHISIPASQLNIDIFEQGKMFDGSSLPHWKGIHDSDMVLLPEVATAALDPFYEEPTLILRCDVLEPSTGMGYHKDPRTVARRAEQYMGATGIADVAYFGPEPEWFVFDDVCWRNDTGHSFYRVNSEEAVWNAAATIEGGNIGHRPRLKGGYSPVPPVDAFHDLRSSMCLALESVGIPVEVHHHEVATAGQNEIGIRYNSLLNMADKVMMFKYVVHNVAHAYGKTATFMPKPLVGDNGSGMHCHQSLSKGGENLFAGDQYAGLSETALYYMGGIIKHARALNAFTNPTTNSFKRLVPGFEAPVMLAYSARNRSAAIRIPHTPNPKGRRIEVRFPDPAANPYFAFSAILMAGLDGIRHKIHPGDPMDKDLYDLPPEEAKGIPTVAGSLEEALQALDEDRAFLREGDVFSDGLIDDYITMKKVEVNRLRTSTHPVEFEMYYSS